MVVPDQREARAEYDAYNARGVVYFLTSRRRSDGPIKIGRSTRGRLLRRLSQIQVSVPDPINVLFVSEGGPDIETLAHEAFADVRLTGEWFEQSAALRLLVDEMNADFPWWRDDFDVGLHWSVPPIVTRRQLDKFGPADRPRHVRLVG